MKYLLLAIFSFFLFWKKEGDDPYLSLYHRRLDTLASELDKVREEVLRVNPGDPDGMSRLTRTIHDCRMGLKAADFWLRYFEPLAYKRINGPLPVEWETEVFEKFEKPYRRTGGGLSLALLAMEDPSITPDSILQLISMAREAIPAYRRDSVLAEIGSPVNLFLANRLFLLNLAALYTTGFECPDTSDAVPELRQMLKAVQEIYDAFGTYHDTYPLSPSYLAQYRRMTVWVEENGDGFSAFDRYAFIRDFVDPLFSMNQEMIRRYGCESISYMEFSLSDTVGSIFDKHLYDGQDMLGIYRKLEDTRQLESVRRLGRLLFYDPLFSGNNKRACASCHISDRHFTDTAVRTALRFDRSGRLERNTPGLVNVNLSHLLMLDGRHISMFNQARDVTSNPLELNSGEKEILRKVLSCPDYRRPLDTLALATGYRKPQFIHLTSAIAAYLDGFNGTKSGFDKMIRGETEEKPEVIRGFNLFMGKAVCGTCHFVPHFNGSKPPYIGTEFEVLGVPADTAFQRFDADSGRYRVNPAPETVRAFRTSSLRNVAQTMPYMHNGVYGSLEEVLEFYDAGGAEGRGKGIVHQTLPSAKLGLTSGEKRDIIAFLKSLSEEMALPRVPERLPLSTVKKWNERRVGGEY